MARTASSDPRLGTLVAGYRVDALLGRGGMGVVYRARDELLERDIALKLLAAELTEDERFRHRFLRESRVAASLHHPCIVPVYGAGEADGLLWQAMRLVEGSDLKQLLRRERPLEPARALALLEHVAGALDAAHARGLVHRDVKPANVLVEGDPPDERAYLADFGLTRTDASASGASATGQLVGTIDYVPPEQIRGLEVDGRSDVYSLACVLFECLAERAPFAKGSDVAVLYAHLQDEPPRLSDLRPGLPRRLDAVLARGLAKRPEDRQSNAGELIAAARSALAGRARSRLTRAPEPEPAAGLLWPPKAPRRPANRLIGRERELAEVRALLRTNRLVTLIGAGGSGKTRLALELIGAAVDEYPDGAWWVPLQEIRDGELVLPAIAEALNAQEPLDEHLISRAALLVLDNFEQVLPAADALGELLDAAPDVQVLVTSRQPLRLSLEQQYPLLPLAEREALALFLERARQVRPGFEPDDAAAELCRRLDGLPLAIELAAARATVLSPRQMVEHMDSVLPLLTGGPRDAPERQRTLRATIEWSHELLTPEEQTLFARLAVFAGGCTLEAAVDVCGADLVVLAELVDKSLVHREDERFGMLETIHEYAAERLALSGEEDALRDRHADHYVAFARHVEARRHSLEWLDLLDRFESDAANTRAAYGRLLDSDPAAALELAIQWRGRWAARDAQLERLDWVEEALARAPDADPRLRARARLVIGQTLATLGDAEQAAASFAASLSLATEAGAEREIADALLRLGRLDESLARYRELGDDVGVAMALHWLGHVAFEGGDLTRTRELFEESVALNRIVGNPLRLGTVLHSLADCALDQGLIDDAASLYREALDLGVRASSFSRTAYNLGGLAAVEARRGRPESAARLWAAVQMFERESGYLPLDESERSRYERALSGLTLPAPADGRRWADVLTDAVAYARSIHAEAIRG